VLGWILILNTKTGDVSFIASVWILISDVSFTVLGWILTLNTKTGDVSFIASGWILTL
jgi:hypothetical protein